MKPSRLLALDLALRKAKVAPAQERMLLASPLPSLPVPVPAPWTCWRCGEHKPPDRRATLAIATTTTKAEPTVVSYPICSFCAFVFQAALERGTTQTPIVMGPRRACYASPLAPAPANDDDPDLKPWEK